VPVRALCAPRKPREPVRQQRRSRRRRKGLYAKRTNPGTLEQWRFVTSRGPDQYHLRASQPPGDIAQHDGARGVQRLQIIDDHDQVRVARGGVQRREDGLTEKPRVGGSRHPHAESDFERLREPRLDGSDRVCPYLVHDDGQGGEAHLGFGLGARGPDDCVSAGRR
jgi:hypothetical protein